MVWWERLWNRSIFDLNCRRKTTKVAQGIWLHLFRQEELHHYKGAILLPSSGLIQQMTKWWYFTYFSQKIVFHISCKLPTKETICMKLQSLFSGKNLQRQFAWNVKTYFGNKEKYFRMLSAEFFSWPSIHVSVNSENPNQFVCECNVIWFLACLSSGLMALSTTFQSFCDISQKVQREKKNGIDKKRASKYLYSKNHPAKSQWWWGTLWRFQHWWGSITLSPTLI